MNALPQEANSRPGRAGQSGVVVPHQPVWHQRLAAALVVALLRLVTSTLRYRWEDRSGFFQPGTQAGQAIYCVWHNRLALSMRAYFSYIQHHRRGHSLAAVVSASKDGGFLAAILEGFTVQPVRGSSSRRGPQALLELTSWAGKGYDLAITPDGPRGPCYRVREGVISLAQLTGLPIIPFSCHLSGKIRVKSWDRFQIPIPFSRCKMLLGEPVRVPRNATDAEREALRRHLEQELRSMTVD
jgi:lysophospholipid acyltransferase (LPLAT)-like uncharacterized protein